MGCQQGWHPGFCTQTETGELNDCHKGHRGSWANVGSALLCTALCQRCGQCGHVSYSSLDNDCSWFTSCPQLHTIPKTGHCTRAVNKEIGAIGTRYSTAVGEWADNLTDLAHVLRTEDWISLHMPRGSLLVQVGANDHAKIGFNHQDKGMLAVAAGWEALLYEPLPSTFHRLQANYKTNSLVRPINAAICGKTSPRRVCVHGATLPLYFVDITIRTGNYGSSHADARCAHFQYGAAEKLSELSSFSRAHLARHQQFWAHTPKACKRCAALLGSELPKDCMNELLTSNMRQQDVRCACFRDDLKGLTRSGGRQVDLLLIDVSGAVSIQC
jgi:hypothetical protein